MDPSLFDLNAEIEGAHWWFAGRRSIMRAVLEHGLPPGATTIVDIGCGTGGNVASLSDRWVSVGIDPSAEAIAHARRRFPDTEFLHGTAPGDLGDWAQRADAFLLMDVLEHVSDDKALLASLVEPLRPGSRILITVPADQRLWSDHDVSHGHFRRYDAASLRAAWSGLPVTELLLSHFNSRLYPVVRLVRALRRRRGHQAADEGSDLSMPMAPTNAVLRRIFSGESRRITRALAGNASAGYRRGVSLLALLRCEAA